MLHLRYSVYCLFFSKISLAYETRITALSTKGRSSKAMWVEEYQIEYSDDDVNWSMYSENGSPKVTNGLDTIDSKGKQTIRDFFE